MFAYSSDQSVGALSPRMCLLSQVTLGSFLSTHRICVIGGPGVGKSTLIKRYSNGLLQERAQEDSLFSGDPAWDKLGSVPETLTQHDINIQILECTLNSPLPPADGYLYVFSLTNPTSLHLLPPAPTHTVPHLIVGTHLDKANHTTHQQSLPYHTLSATLSPTKTISHLFEQLATQIHQNKHRLLTENRSNTKP